jgi:hypothetical protein
MRRYELAVLGQSLLAAAAALASGCKPDDPLSGPVGGTVLTIRSFPATKSGDLEAIASIHVTTNRVEVDHSQSADGQTTRVVTDTHERDIVIDNAAGDFIVGQLEAPVGFVSTVRLFPKAVTIILKSGRKVDLEVPGPNVPSWQQSGWKLQPADGKPWPIRLNELTGIRGLFRFDEAMLHNKGQGYKFKPTLPAESFQVNPPEGKPGVLADRLFVVFKPGTSLARIAAIHAGINASTEFSPQIGSGYRVKLPVSTDLKSGLEYYLNQPEVVGAHPGVNMVLDAAPTLEPTEGFRFEQDGLPSAWKAVFDANHGLVGSHTIRVGLIDEGVFLDDPDLRLNIGINQGELPVALFDQNGDGKVTDVDIAQLDTDGDGVISFRDLNDPKLKSIAPVDRDGDGIVEPTELLADKRYVNGIDEDGGKVDDLLGWNFAENNNDTFSSALSHGSNMALIIGAEANNGKFGDLKTGAVGAMWRVSIVPLVASSFLQGAMMEATVFEAIRYAELHKLDVVLIPGGTAVWRKGTGLNCAKKNTPGFSNDPFPPTQYDDFVNTTIPAMWRAPFIDPATGQVRSHALYVMSSGNDSADIGDPGIFRFPSEAIKQAIPDSVMIVGGYGGNFDAAATTNYSGKDGPVDIFGPNAWRTKANDFLIAGTSAAAAAVAGVAGLTVTRFPELTGQPKRLRRQLIDTGVAEVDVVGLEFLPPCGVLIRGLKRIEAFQAVSTPPVP